MLPSGNDAAFTLAEHFGQILMDNKIGSSSLKGFGGSPFNQYPTVKHFLRQMNLNAQALGMNDTFYDSPHGLRNERNFSTAYDVAILVEKCMKIPAFWQVVSTSYQETRALGNSA